PHYRHLPPELAQLALVPPSRHGLDVREHVSESLLRAPAELRTKIVVEDAERVRPELVDSLAEPPPAFVARTQAVDPHLRVHAVVRLLAIDLRRDAGYLGVLGALQCREPDLVGGLVQPVPRDRARPLQPAQLDERGAAVFVGVAVEGELVGGGAELSRRELVQRPGVAGLVLRDR